MTTNTGASPAADASLAQWLDWQLGLHRDEIQLGLERVARVADRLGLRRQPPLTLTIGGTNGKGAATRLAADLLQRAGHCVGQFTSPHLHDYAERIVVNGQPVDPACIVEAFVAIESQRGDTPLTYFEFGTLAALWVFRARGCTAQVLEVGLGGRLDAVNLLDADAALITSIGTDHGDWLGDSRQAIAVEKAGIFRPGKVAVCAEHAPPAELAPHLAERDIRPLWIGQAFSVVSDGGPHWQLQAADGPTLSLPQPPHLPGLHQLRNAAGVITLLQHLRPSVVLPEGALDAALRAWALPGRFERRGRYVLDVAHNAEAALALATLLPGVPQPVHLVLGMLSDKPCEDVVAALAPQVQSIRLVDTPGPRGMTATTMARRLGDAARQVQVVGDMRAALAQAARSAGTVLVCGSFMTVVAARDIVIEQEAARG